MIGSGQRGRSTQKNRRYLGLIEKSADCFKVQKKNFFGLFNIQKVNRLLACLYQTRSDLVEVLTEKINVPSRSRYKNPYWHLYKAEIYWVTMANNIMLKSC